MTEAQRAKLLGKIDRSILKSDPKTKPGSDAFKVAQLLLASAHVGANRDRLHKLTGIPRGFIYRVERRLRASDVWRGNRVECEWMSKDGGVAFWLDVSVGMGWLRRTAVPTTTQREGAGKR